MPAPDIYALAAYLNATYPTRNWDQQCAALVWNALNWLSDGGEPRAYDPALAAYRASRIESMDPTEAPPGAIHYWDYPAPYGHVAIDWGGGGQALMTTAAPTVRLGQNFGVRSVPAYTASKPTRYLGWSLGYGTNASVVDLFRPDPDTAPEIHELENLPMLTQIGTPRPDGGQDYWLRDAGAHTYSHVPTTTQVEFNKNIGIPTFIDQAPAVLQGYEYIPADRRVLTVEMLASQASN